MSDLMLQRTAEGESEDVLNKSIYELDLSSSDLFDDSDDYTPAALASQKVYDNSWRAHRVARFNSERLNWIWPSTAKEREEGKARPAELSQIPDHHIVGVRGVPVEIRYGFKLSTGTGTDSKTICQTTKIEELLGERSRVIEDRYPLEVPIKRVHKKKEEPNEPNPWLVDNPHIRLYGSRPPIGTPENATFGRPRTCMECVTAGEHYIGTEDEFKNKRETPVCRMDGYMLFCVMEVAILDYSELLDDPAAGRMKVKWKKIVDANISTTVKNGDRKKIDRPIILKVQGLGLSQHSPIGNNPYELPLQLPSESNQSWLPENGSFMSMGDYYKYINDPRFYGTRHRKLKNQRLAYSQVTEIYLGKLKAKTYNSDYIPAFRAVVEEDIISAGGDLTAQDWMITALQVLQTEKAEVSGTVTDPALAAQKPAAGSLKAGKKKAAPAAKVVAEEEVAEIPQVAKPVSSPTNTEDEEFKAFRLDD